VAFRKLVKKFAKTGSILNVKKIRKYLDENGAVEENPQMLLRNRALQTVH
jgi:predicted enzyme involved in methoxymalonyl-ACP biosynthesis